VWRFLCTFTPSKSRLRERKRKTKNYDKERTRKERGYRPGDGETEQHDRRYDNKLLEQAVNERIILKSFDHVGHVIYALAPF